MKNNITELFKITKVKIIATTIIMVLNILAALYSAKAILCTERCPTPNTLQNVLSPTLYPFVVLQFFSELFEDISFLPEIILTMLVFIFSGVTLLLFWYIIASLILLFFNTIVIFMKNITNNS